MNYMKKTYDTPELIVRGTIEEITQGPSNGWVDAIFGGDGGFQGCTLQGCPSGS